MNSKPFSILHIDDDQVDKMVIEKVIRKLGITTHLFHAADGEEALDLLRGTNGKTAPDPLPNIIITDINMPRMNGLEFLKALRDDPKLRHMSVLIMTTSNDDVDRQEAFSYHVAGYVIKPVDIQQFENTFQTLHAYWKLCEWP